MFKGYSCEKIVEVLDMMPWVCNVTKTLLFSLMITDTVFKHRRIHYGIMYNVKVDNNDLLCPLAHG